MANTKICWIDKFCDTVSNVSSFDCMIFTNWDGVKDPTIMDWHTDPYGFVYDRAEDYCGYITYDGEEYCWSSWSDITGTNVVLRFDAGTQESMAYYKSASVGIHNDGTVDYYNCSGTVENNIYYIKIDPIKPERLYGYKDFSRIENLYGWTEETPLYAWHCATPSGFDEGSAYYYPQTVYTDTPTPTSSSTLYNASGNVLTTSAESTTVAGNTLTQHYTGIQGSGGSND